MDLTSFGVKGNGPPKPREISDSKLDLDMDKIKESLISDTEEKFLPWFLKYKPESFDDLVMTSEMKKIVKFVENFKPGKGLLLHGQAGCGKTTTLTFIAKHYDYEIFELNASDARNKKSILASVGDVIVQKSLFGKDKFILIDEVDGVSGTNDRGGVAELIKLLAKSEYPVVFTANDSESDKIKALKKKCVVIDFENSSQELLRNIAIRIFEGEGVSYDEKDLDKFILERNISDIRGFINDIQTCVSFGKFELNGDLQIRDYKKKIDELLMAIYFSYPQDSLYRSFNSDINIDDLFLYLEENTPNVYDKRGMVAAFNELGKADVYRGRIRRWQYWRFLAYVNFYLTYGVSAVKGDVSKVKFKRNGRILKKWIYGNKYGVFNPRTVAEKKKGVDLKFIERLAKYYGTSARKCRQRDLFYFAFTYKNDKEFAAEMDEKLGIDSNLKIKLFDLV